MGFWVAEIVAFCKESNVIRDPVCPGALEGVPATPRTFGLFTERHFFTKPYNTAWWRVFLDGIDNVIQDLLWW